MTPLALLRYLRHLDVYLTPLPDGAHLRINAPVGVLTEEMRAAMRQHKEALLSLVEAFEERAGMLEYDAGLARDDAEWLAWQELGGKFPQAPPLAPTP
jgi:TubC N-terminal docking domain